MQIRQINLPVSLNLLETYGPYAPSTSSCDGYIFKITWLSLSLSDSYFSGRSRSVPHWAVIIWSSSKFSNSFWLTWSCIISTSDVLFCKFCSDRSLTEGVVEISSSFCSLYSPWGLIWSTWANILFPFFSIYYSCFVAFSHNKFCTFWVWFFVLFVLHFFICRIRHR